MSAVPIFSELSDKGLRVRVDGPDLILTPKKALTPNLASRIKKEKPARRKYKDARGVSIDTLACQYQDKSSDSQSERYMRTMWLRADIHVPAGCRLHRQLLCDDALSQLSKTQRCDAR